MHGKTWGRFRGWFVFFETDPKKVADYSTKCGYIREYGEEQRFYHRGFIYFEEDGSLYWTMGFPIPETTIINQCKVEDSYENRLESNSLP